MRFVLLFVLVAGFAGCALRVVNPDGTIGYIFPVYESVVVPVVVAPPPPVVAVPVSGYPFSSFYYLGNRDCDRGRRRGWHDGDGRRGRRDGKDRRR